jgi:tetratricopeptide (TPR) repeat protein
MDKLLKTSLLVLALLATGTSFSQKREIAKANKEFDKYAYIDARKIYLKVVEDGYESAELYEKLGDTYYWNSDYDNAAKWYKKLLQRFQKRPAVNTTTALRNR